MGAFPFDQEISSSVDALNGQLFSSLSGSNETLKGFMTNWVSFEDRFRGICDDLHEDTIRKVDSFASVVAAVVGGVSNTHTAFERISSEAGTTIDEALFVDGAERSPSLAPYIGLASQWLAGNIYNPYPSPATRDGIAKKSNSSRRDVDNWFLDVRKKIGWNELRKSQFSNKRADIVDAATRFFLDIDPSRPLPPALESSFAHIQNRVKELYADKFQASHLATKLEKAVVDITLGGKRRGKRHSPSLSKPEADRIYPTPRASPPLAPSPTPTTLELPLAALRDDVPVLVPEPKEQEGSLKRRRSPSTKGSRSPSPTLQRHLSIVPPEGFLPSPVFSTFDETELQQPPHYPTSEASASLKRKRRSSGASNPEELPSLKRVRTASISQPQAASDPLPVTHATTEELSWDQLLDFSILPLPVSLFSADDIVGPVDVSPFDFLSWEQYGCGSLALLQVTSSSSSTFDVGVVDSFSMQQTKPLDDGLSHSDSIPHSEPSGLLEELLSTKATGPYNLPNISSDFVLPANQAIDPIALPTDTDCLPNFPVPLHMTPQAILAQAQVTPEPATATPKSGLRAKQEQLRLLQAQIAALTAEIASES
uniref:Homeodomain mating-type protein n=1 Tax=Coprinellus disseminatus TaxID=71703 RepID=Q1WMN7_COPDI|nr:homeodomain mating-type protein [Coprinellus disseminatus]